MPTPTVRSRSGRARRFLRRTWSQLCPSYSTCPLEIGTGCGYHAAVTAELVGPENVFSVEYHATLADEARETLAATGYGSVSVRAGDGKQGWPEHAPYDRTYLTCAAPDFPAPLVEQTHDGGVLLAPIGDGQQRLIRAEKQAGGTLEKEDHGSVRFVPLQ